MKKITSIKTRITIWYTSLMFVLIFIVLSLVGGLSYQLSTDSLEKDVILQVTQVTEKLSKMQRDVFVCSTNLNLLTVFMLSDFHFSPTEISVNIVKKKCYKTHNDRNISNIREACQYPKNNKHNIIRCICQSKILASSKCQICGHKTCCYRNRTWQ